MFTNQRIAVRLGIGFGTLLLFMVLVGGVGLRQMATLSETTRKMYRHPFAVSNAVQRINTHINGMHRSMKDVTLAENRQEMVDAIANVRELEQQSLEDFQIISRRFLGDPEMYLRAQDVFLKWRPIREEVIRLVREGNKSEAARITKGKGADYISLIRGRMDELSDFAQKMAEKFYRESNQARQRIFLWMYLALGAAVMVGVFFTWLITRSITRPAREIATVSEALARGDLDQKISYQSRDELGRMAESLRNMLSGVIGEGQSIKNGLPVALWTADTDLTVTYLNPPARRMVEELNGREAPDVVGKMNLSEVIKDRDGALVDAARQSLEQGTQPGFEAVFDKNGKSIFMQCAVSRLLDLSGKARGVMGVAIDISALREEEEKSARLGEQLRQTQKMEAIGRLAGGVAHDLNNMLTPVLGYGEMLMQDLSKEDEKFEFAQQIREAAVRAKELVRQLLAFGRKQPLQIANISINQVIKGLEPLLTRTLREDIRLEKHLASSLSKVKVDVTQVEQVVMNLAVNAQDAMPDGGCLTLETMDVELDENYAHSHAEVQPGRYALLAVSDTGTGMDSETRDNIFEPFFTTKEREHGTGLGLATVYGIIKQHGGHLWVYSEPGHGATFKIYLPVSSEEPLAQEAPIPAITETLGGTETLMIAEDDPLVRNLAVNVLKRHGYTVHSAETGGQCLEKLQGHEGPLDLLLTDVVMPEMNGRELYRRVEELFPDVRVLYMSGYTENVIVHHGVLDEAVDLLLKPFSVQTLALRVRQALEKEAA